MLLVDEPAAQTPQAWGRGRGWGQGHLCGGGADHDGSAFASAISEVRKRQQLHSSGTSLSFKCPSMRKAMYKLAAAFARLESFSGFLAGEGWLLFFIDQLRRGASVVGGKGWQVPLSLPCYEGNLQGASASCLYVRVSVVTQVAILRGGCLALKSSCGVARRLGGAGAAAGGREGGITG